MDLNIVDTVGDDAPHPKPISVVLTPSSGFCIYDLTSPSSPEKCKKELDNSFSDCDIDSPMVKFYKEQEILYYR